MRRLFSFEIASQRKSWLVWAGVLSSLILLIMVIYGSLQDELLEAAKLFEQMGAFTEALGMNRLNMGTVLGYYGIEIGVIAGLGLSMYASIVGINVLAKEEANRTSEFLFTHPLSRTQIITVKLLSIIFLVISLSIVLFLVGILSFVLLEEPIAFKELGLYHLALTFMALQISALCFCLSAFFKRQNYGMGLGIALIMYFLSLIYNLTDDAWFLRYVSPFVYADAALIIGDEQFKWEWMFIGMVVSIMAVLIAYWWYNRKDLDS